MADMENDDLVFHHRVKNRISEPTNINSPDSSHFSLFCRIRMFTEPLDRGVDEVCERRAAGRMMIQQVRHGLIDFDQRSEAMQIPIFIPQAAIPLGCALMILGLLVRRAAR